jgi:hypothetical protein
MLIEPSNKYIYAFELRCVYYSFVRQSIISLYQERHVFGINLVSC